MRVSAMRFGICDNHQRVLVRGVAVFLLGGLATGCSSDVMRFENSILTGSSRTTPQPVVAQQAYPGNSQLDQTTTASVARGAPQGTGILYRAGLIPRPQGNVGAGGAMIAAAPHNPYPGNQGSYQPSAQPAYTPVASGSVASSPLPPPSGVDTTVTGTTAPLSPVQVAAQPMPQPVAPANPNGVRADLPGNKVPVPGAPGERLAVLPNQPKLTEPQPGTQTASNDTARNTSPAGNIYTVVAGDTLNGIAGKTGASAEALRQANGLTSGLIRIGQRLVIPAGGGNVQTAQAPKVDQTTTGTTPKPQAAAYTPPQKAESVIQQAAIDTSAQAPDATGIGRMRWPVRGRVISEFGGNSGGKKNDGIDIAVPAGTPVKAAENGVVIYAGDGLKEFGNTVLVRHEDGLVTVYGHASEIKVQRGQKVRRGEDIALAGMSGSAETPKLHFEVRKDSTPVNPSGFLE